MHPRISVPECNCVAGFLCVHITYKRLFSLFQVSFYGILRSVMAVLCEYNLCFVSCWVWVVKKFALHFETVRMCNYYGSISCGKDAIFCCAEVHKFTQT